jgi:hypothetical protein
VSDLSRNAAEPYSNGGSSLATTLRLRADRLGYPRR